MDKKHESNWLEYTDIWSEPDRSKRLRLFNTVLSEDFVYTDPLVEIDDADALASYIDVFQQTFPGAHFAVKTFRTHHRQGLAEWNLIDAEGVLLHRGTSTVYYSADNKFERITGYFDVP